MYHETTPCTFPRTVSPGGGGLATFFELHKP
jgi:hypothetical protein